MHNHYLPFIHYLYQALFINLVVIFKFFFNELGKLTGIIQRFTRNGKMFKQLSFFEDTLYTTIKLNSKTNDGGGERA